MLEKVDLDVRLSKEEYEERRRKAGKRLVLLQRSTWDKKIPIVVVFEGWDAAGKGSSINLLTQYLDPRGFKLHAITGATKAEKQMPWLWRFWQIIPNSGEIAIFDRSWYGRVMVERVEGLIQDDRWRDAYQDINEFEHTLADEGYVIVKFFLHISKKEQKKRFKKLEKSKVEAWRVQKEDWKHHEKYAEYRTAVEEMLARTNNEWAAWTIVEATQKRWSRVKVMETLVYRMEEALKEAGYELAVDPEEEAPANRDDGRAAEEVPHA